MVDHGCTLHLFIPQHYMHCVCLCVWSLFVTLCVTCNFDADARVRMQVSENTLKKPLTKQSLEEPDQWQLELICTAGKD